MAGAGILSEIAFSVNNQSETSSIELEFY